MRNKKKTRLVRLQRYIENASRVIGTAAKSGLVALSSFSFLSTLCMETFVAAAFIAVFKQGRRVSESRTSAQEQVDYKAPLKHGENQTDRYAGDGMCVGTNEEETAALFSFLTPHLTGYVDYLVAR